MTLPVPVTFKPVDYGAPRRSWVDYSSQGNIPAAVWRNLTIVAKRYAFPSEPPYECSEAEINQGIAYGNLLPLRVTTQGGGLILLKNETLVLSQPLTQYQDFAGTHWIRRSHIDSLVPNTRQYDSLFLLTSPNGAPLPGFYGLSFEGMSQAEIRPIDSDPEYGDVHEWLHVAGEGWFRDQLGLASQVPPVHGGELIVNWRTGLPYGPPWIDYYTDYLTGMILNNAPATGITRATWIKGKPTDRL